MMTYDMLNDYQTLSPHTALKNSQFSIQLAIELWSQSVPVNKLVVGVAAYGRAFSFSGSPTIGSIATGQGTAGVYTQEFGFLAYYEISLMIADSSTTVVQDAATTTVIVLKS
jgi:GH18 family chitinase